MFQCQGKGNIFWHVDDIPLVFSNFRALSERGVLFEETFLGDNEVSSTLTLQSSLSINNNNTVIRCTVVGPDDAAVNISTATLTIIGMSITSANLNQKCVKHLF